MAVASIQRSSLSSTIEDVASSYVGQMMGKAAGTAHLQRLAIEDERLTSSQVEAVLRSLQSSLKVLIGDQTAQKAVAEIKKRIGMT